VAESCKIKDGSSFFNCQEKKANTGCNSILPGFKYNEKNLVNHMNAEILHSYDYLLLASRFGTFHDNRPGFRKLYKDLSDKAWKNSIELIKYVTKRGGKVEFKEPEFKDHIEPQPTKISSADLDELTSLKKALDVEKRMARHSHHIHEHASHAKCPADYDPAISHFVEEHYFEDQTETIRKLAGYNNDLKMMVNEAATKQLAIYLFDEYLQKQ
jgi:ferritin heavy chain